MLRQTQRKQQEPKSAGRSGGNLHLRVNRTIRTPVPVVSGLCCFGGMPGILSKGSELRPLGNGHGLKLPHGERILTSRSLHRLLFLAPLSLLLFRAFSFKQRRFLFILTGSDSRTQPTLEFAPRKMTFFCPRLRLSSWQCRDGRARRRVS